MAKQERKKLSFFKKAFYILALIFLALGLGTLGSVQGVGGAYELYAKNSESGKFYVVFDLQIPTRKNDAGEDEKIPLKLNNIYINVASSYAAAGTDAEISFSRASGVSEGKPVNENPSSTSSYSYFAKLENFIPAKVETEEGKEPEESTAIKDAFWTWVAPYGEKIQGQDFSLNSYHYWQIMSHGCNLLVNEVAFVGEVLTESGGTGTGELMLVPAVIKTASPVNGETNAAAKVRAKTLVDAQVLPSTAQSSFGRFTAEEKAILTTIAEMRLGSRYIEGNVYHGDKIYNSLGLSMAAFGVTIFGTSPFGLRFFSMLASFGVLAIGFYFVRALFRSEKAGFYFALVYALSNFSFGLGHLGTPLMLGVFFFLCSLYGAFRYYRDGLKNTGFTGVVPLLLSGLCGAAAVSVNGAFIIPVAGVVALFAAGLVKQVRLRKAMLSEAVEEAELEEEGKLPAPAAGEEDAVRGKAKVAVVLSENGKLNRNAPAAFFVSLIAGGVLLSLLFLLPVYFTAVKLYDNPASPKLNAFVLAFKLFAGGFVGVNEGGAVSVWNVFAPLFRGTGDMYAVTALVMNPVAALFGLLGIAYAVYRIVLVCQGKAEKSELIGAILPLAIIIVGVVLATFAKGAFAFAFLAYIGAFIAGAQAINFALEGEGKLKTAGKVVAVTGVVLLAVCFLLFAVFTFSIPLPAAFISKF